jgi:hypothetical protein
MVEAFLADGPHLRTRLLRRPHEGKGSTVRAGLKAVSAEYAGFCDVDLSTQLDQLELILEPASPGLCRPSAPARRLLPAC